MKKFIAGLMTAAVSGLSLTPLLSNAIYTETDTSSENYKRLIEDSILLDKSLWPSWYTTGWSAEHYPYDRVYLHVDEHEARLTSVRDMEKAVRYNITPDSKMSQVEAVLNEYNSENGTNLLTSMYSYSSYQYIIKDGSGNLSSADVKKVGKLLKEAGLITDFYFMADRCNLSNAYTTNLTAYRYVEHNRPYMEILKEYVEEKGLDCEVKLMYKPYYASEWAEVTEDTVIPSGYDRLCFVIPNDELTTLEHFCLMLQIREDTGLCPEWITPEIADQEATLSIDVFNAVDGDANEDGELNMADAVFIMQAMSNPDKYTLTAQGRFNADISDTGDGITAKDALAVQRILLGLE